MQRITISSLKSQIGNSVNLYGWAETIRKQSKIIFIILRDRSGKVQLVIEKDTKKEFELAEDLSNESVIAVKGQVVEQKQAFNGVEIKVEHMEVLSKAEQILPIPVVEKGKQEQTSINKRLDYRWIDLRKPQNALIFEIGTDLIRFMSEFFYDKDFIQAATPKIMASPSESNAELFEIKYFGKKAYLAQSAQFYKQMAMASGFEGFFTFGDTYRADPSSTIWHMTQFVTLDVEKSFIESEHDIFDLEEDLIRFTLEKIHEKYGKKIEDTFGIKIPNMKEKTPRITMKEAKDILEKVGCVDRGSADLTTKEEKAICDWAQKEKGSDFIFVYEFPWDVRPFYHMKRGENTTRSGDLLFRGREISTDAQREHRYDVLVNQLQEKKLKKEELQHYLDFFRYGCPPHGGFGLGPERFLMLLLGLNNIREVTYLPRDMKRLLP